jgi:UDP-N-acetylmuramate--alanine ligase
MFQPHGFGPLKLMGREIAAAFKDNLSGEDMLLMPEAYYAGGTADRSVTAKHVVEWVGPQAQWFEKRGNIAPVILSKAKPGDRIIIMGARDDTLSDFAKDILKGL